MIYLLQFDRDVFRFFNSFAGVSPLLDNFFVFLAEYIIYLMVAGLGLFVLLKAKDKLRQTAVLQALAAGFLARGVLDSIVRALHFRPRPFLAGVVHQLVAHNPAEGSFPSGHASIMFALAFAIFSVNKKWGVIYLILALISSLSRIVAGVHYPLDIIAGILIGALAACIAKKFFDFWFSRRRRKGAQQQ